MDDSARRILESFDRLGLSRLTVADFADAAGSAGEADKANKANGHASTEAAIRDLVAADALREIAGGYERTEFGRLESADQLTLTLLGRQACHLCHDVLVWLEPLAARLGVTLRKIDVDTDRVLRERYGNEVPVLFLGAGELARNQLEGRLVEKSVKKARQTRDLK